MIYFIFCLYAHLHGISNAVLYSRKGADALPGNEHRYLVGERALVLIAGLTGAYYGHTGEAYGLTRQFLFLFTVNECIAAALAFSFFHNRAYYVYRDKIDGTHNGPRHKSPTSTADADFSYPVRLTLLIVSIAVMIVNVLSLFRKLM